VTYSAIVTLSIITVLHTVYRDAVKELATYSTPMDIRAATASTTAAAAAAAAVVATVTVV